MRRVLIIDDEPIAREVLQRLVATHLGFTVTGTAGTFDDAAALLARADYDLVLLDIQLRGGSGFDLVPSVRPGARTIFVTAYDRFALRAFEVNALDYLLKPITAARFAAALHRLTESSSSPPFAASSPASQPCTPDTPLSPDVTGAVAGVASSPVFTIDDSVLVRTDHGDRFVPVAEIAAIISDGNYSHVHLRDGTHHFTRRTLKHWEDLLPSAQFFRVHRQTLVNLACIESHQPLTREILSLRVAGVREPLSVSRHAVPDLLARLPSGRR